MKRTYLVIAVAFGLMLAPSAQSTTITFDDLAAGELGVGVSPTNEYLGSGVLVTTSTNATTYVTNSSYSIGTFPGDTGSNFLVVNSTWDPSIGWGWVTMSFVAPGNSSVPGWADGSSISFYYADTEQSVSARSFDRLGNLVEDLELAAPYGTFSFSLGQIDHVTFWDKGGDGFILDSYQYGPVNYESGVPEPATLATVGGALLLLGLLGRRLRR